MNGVSSFVRMSLVVVVMLVTLPGWGQDRIMLSERSIPVSYHVDVLVLGGSTAAVSAACESATAGAKTMLITNFPYLGEDRTATLRLWRDAEEEKAGEPDSFYSEMMTDPQVANALQDSALDMLLANPKKLSFKYAVLQPINPRHSETKEKNRLNDAIAESPSTDSLQVDGDVTLILDLNKKQEVGVLSLIGYYRQNHFVLNQVTYYASDDKENWTSVGSVQRSATWQPLHDAAEDFTLKLEKPISARYIKVEANMANESNITLLGEVILLANQSDLTATALVKKSTTEKMLFPPRPLHVKQYLDEALLKANVEFLYSTYVTEQLKDSQDEWRGVCITSRAGRQAIVAKQVIDARVDYKEILSSYPSTESVQVEYVVVGGSMVPFEKQANSPLLNGHCEIMGAPWYDRGAKQARKAAEFPLLRYQFEVDPKIAREAFSGDFAKFAQLESAIRLATYQPDQQFVADRITLLPHSTMPASAKLGNQFGKAVIGMGRKAGQAAAKQATSQAKVDLTALTIKLCQPLVEGKVIPGDVREYLANIRSYEKPLDMISEKALSLPIAGVYDVVVVGGGTTGAPAGIAAARGGAKTLVIEYLHDLGGVGTAGVIASYYWGNRVGFCEEISQGAKNWNVIQKAQLWRTKLLEAGGEVWFGALGAGAIVETKPNSDGRDVVKGILIATEFGPKLVLAKVVIDTTGSADIARTAGAGMNFVTEQEISVQGSGLPPRYLGGRYMNNDYTYIDDTDPIDVTHVYVLSKGKFPTAFDQGKILNTRERRRVVGEFSFTPLDMFNKRTYPDSIARAFSNFDTHGYTIEPFLEIRHPEKVGVWAYYPYRSSIPKGLEGMLVGGLGTSCHRDSLPVIRMQSDLQNQGYGLGYAAAMVIKEKVPVRNVDIRNVQKHLVEIGNLPESALTEEDNYEALKSQLPDVIKTVPESDESVAMVLWYPAESLPLLRKVWGEANSKETKLAYAKVMAAMGDGTGEQTLLEALKEFDAWDPGWNFKGMSQFGMASSPQDQIMTMLGRIKSKAAVPLIATRLAELKYEDDFSHHRACTLALEWIGEPSGAASLAAHLKKPNMQGYIHDTIEKATLRDREDPRNALGEKSRRDSLVEIGAARALYLLGDVDGLGESILRAYSKDLRGLFARHAGEILNDNPYMKKDGK